MHFLFLCNLCDNYALSDHPRTNNSFCTGRGVSQATEASHVVFIFTQLDSDNPGRARGMLGERSSAHSNPRRCSEELNDRVTALSDSDPLHRDAAHALKAKNEALGQHWQLLEASAGPSRSAPAFEALIVDHDALQALLLSRELLQNIASVWVAILPANFHLREAIQAVQLGKAERREAVDCMRVANHHRVEPTAPPWSPRGCPVFVTWQQEITSQSFYTQIVHYLVSSE